jgi:hypothetical protein
MSNREKLFNFVHKLEEDDKFDRLGYEFATIAEFKDFETIDRLIKLLQEFK